jgi:group I intron endonuclease
LAAGIYQILNKTNSKSYIGSAVDITKRFSHHRWCLRKGSHANSYLQKSWGKYSEEGFEFKTLIECLPSDLDFYENLIISGYKTNERQFGYNLREVSHSNRGMQTNRNTHKPGDKYNRLTLVKALEEVNKSGARKWLVRCDCGTEFKVMPGDVRHDHTKSCGCLNREKLVERINTWNKENPEPWNKKNKDTPANGGQDALSHLFSSS